ncbi:hypothetical protein [Variovorax sp. PBL-E5]|uniref:hypothetical protein n=1 Tax=Variovorax sp. PBL-E5 TaxID=434014 RepID=UPI001E3DABA0|nr:hypothetical protein [Variovorax sp. PBL-E5]
MTLVPPPTFADNGLQQLGAILVTPPHIPLRSREASILRAARVHANVFAAPRQWKNDFR